MAILSKRGLLLAAWMLTFYVLAPARAELESSREYSLKAAFLYNFCQFIEWPDTAFAGRGAPLVIGVLGDDPFGSLLEETVEGEVVRGRRLRVERYRRVEDARRCQILFICGSEGKRSGAIVAALRGRSVVTVGETADFLEQGGMIALLSDQNRVKLRINPAMLRSSNLTVSSKLLRVADLQR